MITAASREFFIAAILINISISFMLASNAHALQLGRAGEVDWFNKGKAFYPWALDRVLHLYDEEYEEDRDHTGLF